MTSEDKRWNKDTEKANRICLEDAATALMVQFVGFLNDNVFKNYQIGLIQEPKEETGA